MDIFQIQGEKLDILSQEFAEMRQQLDTKGMQDTLAQEKMKKLEEALDAQHRLIQKMQTAGLRPALDISSYTSSLSHPHHEAFLNYVRKGIEPTWTSKSMNASEGTEGGYLIPHGVSDHIHSLLKEESFFRKVARVTTISNDAFEMLIDKGEAAVGWAQERDPREETTTPELSKVRNSGS